MGSSFILAPSLLSADFSRLAEELQFIKANGGQWVHLDVMDGAFVPNLTFGAPVVRMKVGVSIVPSTPVHLLEEVLPFVDLVLVMTVNPGFGGQTMIPHCLGKIEKLCEYRKQYGYRYLISVDGGVNAKTLPAVCNAGADVVVSGSSFFSGDIKK